METTDTKMKSFARINEYFCLPTAPHHKHVSEGEVIAAALPDLETILRKIETLIQTLSFIIFSPWSQHERKILR